MNNQLNSAYQATPTPSHSLSVRFERSASSSDEMPAPKSSSLRRSLVMMAILGFVAMAAPTVARSQTENAENASSQDSIAESQESIAERQARLAQKYSALEEKLFALFEYELSQNPDRSELLKRAFDQSQDRRVSSKLEEIVSRLKDKKYKPALDEQRAAVEQLQAILLLLQNEDQSKRKQEEQRRVEAYLAEVERLLRIQQGIRGQTEGGVSPERLAKSQEQVAERAGKLANEIQQDQSTEDSRPTNSNSSESANNSSEENQQSKTPDGQGEKGTEQDSTQNPNQDSSDNKPGKDSKPPSPSQSPSPSQGQQGSPNSASPDQSQPQDSVQQKIEQAQQRMRQAQQRLEQAERDESIQEMRQAEAELAAAKRELEEILRQLREEEIEQTLQALEIRFRDMLEAQRKVNASTERLSAIPDERRTPDFAIESNKLSASQLDIALEADRLLLILQEEGSAIAFPETMVQIRDDMEEVAQRLKEANVGPLTLALEEDIELGLQDLLNALVAAQEDQKERQEQQQSQQNSPPNQNQGEPPLINQLEELKLVRNLQIRINRRHTRYSDLLDDPADPIGHVADPEIQRALEDLAGRQKNLREIVRDIITQQ